MSWSRYGGAISVDWTDRDRAKREALAAIRRDAKVVRDVGDWCRRVVSGRERVRGFWETEAEDAA